MHIQTDSLGQALHCVNNLLQDGEDGLMTADFARWWPQLINHLMPETSLRRRLLQDGCNGILVAARHSHDTAAMGANGGDRCCFSQVTSVRLKNCEPRNWTAQRGGCWEETTWTSVGGSASVVFHRTEQCSNPPCWLMITGCYTTCISIYIFIDIWQCVKTL